jgi:uncharacterized protein (DUF427 family)
VTASARSCGVAPAAAVTSRSLARGHEIVITPGDLHVEITVDGKKVAESDRPVLLDETGLPTRYYLPPEDVRMDLLRRTAHTSTCPFKGQASYWTLQVGEEVYENVAWSYEDPIPGAAGIAGLLAFYDNQVDVAAEPIAAMSSGE